MKKKIFNEMDWREKQRITEEKKNAQDRLMTKRTRMGKTPKRIVKLMKARKTMNLAKRQGKLAKAPEPIQPKESIENEKSFDT
ncbi:MAG: hypothetical protein U0R44_02570 [Candidatus Micrarchaeia archaeon]